jgi:hypothetical protein
MNRFAIGYKFSSFKLRDNFHGEAFLFGPIHNYFIKSLYMNLEQKNVFVFGFFNVGQGLRKQIVLELKTSLKYVFVMFGIERLFLL